MSEVRVQFLQFDGCPLADAVREVLEEALVKCGMTGYEDIDILDPATPEDLGGWSSPTILVNGADVTGAPKGDSVGCRIYPGPDRIPAAATIVATIQQARSGSN